ncbi:hypothetical protein AmDm5_2913 [Acetobacter malorum]|nr:hypothetical protein AmDm5_2913 [Acetobacter malorum]
MFVSNNPISWVFSSGKEDAKSDIVFWLSRFLTFSGHEHRPY